MRINISACIYLEGNRSHLFQCFRNCNMMNMYMLETCVAVPGVGLSMDVTSQTDMDLSPAYIAN